MVLSSRLAMDGLPQTHRALPDEPRFRAVVGARSVAPRCMARAAGRGDRDRLALTLTSARGRRNPAKSLRRHLADCRTQPLRLVTPSPRARANALRLALASVPAHLGHGFRREGRGSRTLARPQAQRGAPAVSQPRGSGDAPARRAASRRLAPASDQSVRISERLTSVCAKIAVGAHHDVQRTVGHIEEVLAKVHALEVVLHAAQHLELSVKVGHRAGSCSGGACALRAGAAGRAGLYSDARRSTSASAAFALGTAPPPSPGALARAECGLVDLAWP